MQQPTDAEYNARVFVPEPPAPVVQDLSDATLGEVRQELQNLRVYIGRLYMAYKELVNLKADLVTVLQSAISYRDQMAQLALPLKEQMQELQHNIDLINGDLKDIAQTRGLEE